MLNSMMVADKTPTKAATKMPSVYLCINSHEMTHFAVVMSTCTKLTYSNDNRCQYRLLCPIPVCTTVYDADKAHTFCSEWTGVCVSHVTQQRVSNLPVMSARARVKLCFLKNSGVQIKFINSWTPYKVRGTASPPFLYTNQDA